MRTEVITTVAIFAALLSISAAAAAASNLFESALWPGEGRPQFQAAATELALRQAPTTESSVVCRMRVAREAIPFDETRYRTLQSGRVRALQQATVSGRVLGGIRSLSVKDYYEGAFRNQRFEVNEGDVLEYLQYRAEGTCFVRFNGQVIDADPCPASDNRFRVFAEPQTEWWIRVVDGTRPAGWLLVEDASVTETGRDLSGRITKQCSGLPARVARLAAADRCVMRAWLASHERV